MICIPTSSSSTCPSTPTNITPPATKTDLKLTPAEALKFAHESLGLPAPKAATTAAQIESSSPITAELLSESTKHDNALY